MYFSSFNVHFKINYMLHNFTLQFALNLHAVVKDLQYMYSIKLHLDDWFIRSKFVWCTLNQFSKLRLTTTATVSTIIHCIKSNFLTQVENLNKKKKSTLQTIINHITAIILLKLCYANLCQDNQCISWKMYTWYLLTFILP